MSNTFEEDYINWLESHNGEPDINFLQMLPTLYELLLPTLESRLNFINVGHRHETFLRFIYHPKDCSHAKVVLGKVDELNATISKLLDINSLVDCV
ncbi:encapsidation protein U35 [Elephant endotheliotropic herpesvirus 1A]|uniref:DNA packaging protein UL33 n=2 Tax=Elephantid herpesvirus 1 TaxID=146015 RepID=M4JTX1_ELHV1|nr:DNA packaging protein UL33 [Elephantid betaherpesvirus 1]AGG16074.1 encapsidation protein U35 [Elephant endotheliotropic herpesvirus 1A]AGE09972.1 DNA packaging protein UL33 [Elephantid betaherpesvirus 1]AGE10081.1 DNA packaging protein UL33 [Elephantid betaherpesvirus 1]QEY96062.1 DNA packaging protein UL33 [Elephant endotheliotropic herpesvirus 1A]QOE74582.1 encapsidation protein U35 [Elephant endotheliotropic herpesvirus 1A]